MILRRHIALVTLLLSVQVGDLLPAGASGGAGTTTKAQLIADAGNGGSQTDAVTAHKEAVEYFREKNYVAAKEAFTKALSCNPSQELAGELYIGRGTSWSHLDNVDESIKDFTAAIGCPVKNKAGIFGARAGAYMRKGNYAAALDDSNSAIALDGRNANFFVSRAFSQYKLGHVDEAIAACSKAIEVNPAFGSAYVLRGRLYELNQAKVAAQMDFAQATKLNTPITPLSEF